MFRKLCFLAFPVAALTAGCAHPWESVLDGNLYTRTHMNRFPVAIIAVDGVYSIQNPRYVEAGVRRLTVEAPPVGDMREPVRKAFDFKVERCVRYWLAAQRATALSPDFELVIDHAELVPGCQPYGATRPVQAVMPAQLDKPIPVPKR
ncbi:MAG: hypothetical protein ACK4XK_12490 [Casimicrobiaceae bacterium]